jgi:hypothetical protein
VRSLSFFVGSTERAATQLLHSEIDGRRGECDSRKRKPKSMKRDTKLVNRLVSFCHPPHVLHQSTTLRREVRVYKKLVLHFIAQSEYLKANPRSLRVQAAKSGGRGARAIFVEK